MTGQLFVIGDDVETAARRAVADEEGEHARMEAALAAARHDRGKGSLLQQQIAGYEAVQPELAAQLAVIHQQAEVIERQAEVIERQAAALGAARAVLVLLVSSRPYQLMRVLGRWGWLEQRILRALR